MTSNVSHLVPIEKQRTPEAEASIRSDTKDSDWKEIHDRVKARDAAMLKDYDSEVDTLLVFAGLFSAILTAFIVDVYQDLKVNNTDVVLQKILSELQSHSAPVPATAASDAHASPSATVSVVITLWFTSLILSLLAALFGIFMKQWLHTYNKWTDVAQLNSLQQGLILRGFYQSSLITWHIPDIFAALGVLLQLALILFVVGLVGYLWTLSFVISPIITTLVLVMVAFSIITIFLPVYFEDCPYKFPLAYVLLKFRTGSSERDWTERDLPIAQSRFRVDGLPMEKAIAEAALLLDIHPNSLETALTHADTDSDAQAVSIRARIRLLSDESTYLLSAIVTTPILLRAHTRTVNTPDFPVFTRHLLRLWELVFSSVANPPGIIKLALCHLEVGITSWTMSDASLERQLAEILVDTLLQRCSVNALRTQIPATELSRVALNVNTWAERRRYTSGSDFVIPVALRALHCATSAVPMQESTEVDGSPTAGLSPITPYLALLDALRHRLETADLLPTSPAPYNQTWHDFDRLRSDSRQMRQSLMLHHDSFLCTRRRGFAMPEGKTEEPRTATFDAESRRLFIGTDEAATWVLDLSTDESSSATPGTLPSAVSFHYAKFTRDGSKIVWGSREGPLLLLDNSLASFSGQALTLEFSHGRGSIPLGFSPDGKCFLIASEISAALLIDTASHEVVMSFEGHSKRILRAAFDPNIAEPLHSRLATSSFDNTVKVWDIESGMLITTFGDLGNGVNGIAWSPSGSMLAISSGNDVRVFDSQTAELQAVLEGHTKLVTHLAFSPSGALLASSSDDKTVRVWNVFKKTCIATLTGPTGEGNQLEFSPNGAYLACAVDNGVWVWDINPSSIHRAAPWTDLWRDTAKRVLKQQKILRNFKQT